VAIVNRAFAQRYFPDGDAIGRTITHQLSIVPGQAARRVIVGIAGDVRQFRLDEPFEPHLFVPHAQMPWPAMALVIRTSLRASDAATVVRAAVASLDPTLPVPIPIELTQALDEALGQPRLRAWLLAVFACAALMLAAIGLYGTVAFAVQQRRGELAIRLVLGATARQTRALVLREGLAVSLAGTAAGALAAIPLTRLVSTLLFGVSAFDIPTVVSVGAVLLAVSAAAAYLPARSIDRLDPVRVVNGE
jgi:putative ABC transport system permease protein